MVYKGHPLELKDTKGDCLFVIVLFSATIGRYNFCNYNAYAFAFGKLHWVGVNYFVCFKEGCDLSAGKWNSSVLAIWNPRFQISCPVHEKLNPYKDY